MFDLAGNVLILTGPDDTLAAVEAGPVTGVFGSVQLADSPDASQNIRCGYGTGSGIDVEGVQYGIVVTASPAPGYKLTNLFLESIGSLGQAAVQVRSGG